MSEDTAPLRVILEIEATEVEIWRHTEYDTYGSTTVPARTLSIVRMPGRPPLLTVIGTARVVRIGDLTIPEEIMCFLGASEGDTFTRDRAMEERSKKEAEAARTMQNALIKNKLGLH